MLPDVIHNKAISHIAMHEGPISRNTSSHSPHGKDSDCLYDAFSTSEHVKSLPLLSEEPIPSPSSTFANIYSPDYHHLPNKLANHVVPDFSSPEASSVCSLSVPEYKADNDRKIDS